MKPQIKYFVVEGEDFFKVFKNRKAAETYIEKHVVPLKLIKMEQQSFLNLAIMSEAGYLKKII